LIAQGANAGVALSVSGRDRGGGATGGTTGGIGVGGGARDDDPRSGKAAADTPFVPLPFPRAIGDGATAAARRARRV